MIFSTVTKHYLSIGFKAVASIFLVMVIAGCGGGKDAAGSTGPGLTLLLANSSGVATAITYVGTTYKLRATVTDSNGAASNAIVTFASGGLGTLNPSSGTALTNSAGVAEVDFTPTAAGAASASASATVTLVTKVAGSTATNTSQIAVSGSNNYSVAASPPAVITLGAISVGNASLGSAGNTSLDVDVFSNGALATANPVPVGFRVSCGVVSPNVVSTDGNGHVTATYSGIKADGSLCQGSVVITAAAANITTQKTITVAAPTTGVVTFVSAAPTQINLASSGASTQSILTFKVLSSGAPQNQLPVTLTLTGNPGGVSFHTLGNTAPVTMNSDANGLVQVLVYAGGTPGAVTIKAEWASNSSVYATSNNFSVASSAPQQRRFSVAVSTSNIEGEALDGVPTSLTAYVADAQGNAVPPGTVVQFTAESGQITSFCTTVLDNSGHSLCEVNFISQNPRPVDGRVTILAYLEGVKNYIDNSMPPNNQFDVGIDSVVDQGDAYRDDNENNQYDLGEFTITKGGNLTCSGVGGVVPAKINTCSGQNQIATTVRTQSIILYASSKSSISILPGQTGFNSTTTVNLNIKINSLNYPLLPMAKDTTVTVTTLRPTCTIASVFPNAIPNVIPLFNPLADLGTNHAIALTGACSGATLYVDTRSPSGVLHRVPIVVP